MEGPSIVILVEELEPFVGKKPKVDGSAPLSVAEWKLLTGKCICEVRSWGKHFLIRFEETWVRIHFLMFGSYRINHSRGRPPKLRFRFGKDEIEFYTCSVKILEQGISDYDWSIDVMSKKWSAGKALTNVKKMPKSSVCDALMDQSIFAGVGNIIKNEVLFLQRMHPERRIGDLNTEELKSLVRSTRAYCKKFYVWKKKNILKRNWQVFRKKTCPECLRTLTKKHTGIGQRRSFYCIKCQKK